MGSVASVPPAWKAVSAFIHLHDSDSSSQGLSGLLEASLSSQDAWASLFRRFLHKQNVTISGSLLLDSKFFVKALCFIHL